MYIDSNRLLNRDGFLKEFVRDRLVLFLIVVRFVALPIIGIFLWSLFVRACVIIAEDVVGERFAVLGHEFAIYGMAAAAFFAFRVFERWKFGFELFPWFRGFDFRNHRHPQKGVNQHLSFRAPSGPPGRFRVGLGEFIVTQAIVLAMIFGLTFGGIRGGWFGSSGPLNAVLMLASLPLFYVLNIRLFLSMPHAVLWIPNEFVSIAFAVFALAAMGPFEAVSYYADDLLYVLQISWVPLLAMYVWAIFATSYLAAALIAPRWTRFPWWQDPDVEKACPSE